MTKRQDLANARYAQLRTARKELAKKMYRAFGDPRIPSYSSDPKHSALQAEWDALDDPFRQAAEECNQADAEALSTKSD
jgi:hypothetical protein